MFKILRSVAIITAVAAAAGVGTMSYFHDDLVVTDANNDPDNAMRYEVAEVEIGNYSGFPLVFSKIEPGKTYEKTVAVRYTGNVIGDLYFGATHGDAPHNIIPILDIKIQKIAEDGTHLGWPIGSWTDAEYVFTHWTKLADNLNPNELTYYKIHLYVDPTANNTYQGNVANNGVTLYAVQDGFGAPNQAPHEYNPTN